MTNHDKTNHDKTNHNMTHHNMTHHGMAHHGMTHHGVIHQSIPSPVGPLLLAADEQGLRLIEFNSPRYPMQRGSDWREGDNDVLRAARAQLEDYFAGRRRTFDLPLAPRGTDFQCEVWHTLATIPYGETISYAQLATWVGKPSAMRAVGAANGRNPLPIVLPCHRVIGSDGSLTGFSGGLPTKQFLLTLEGAMQRTRDDLFAQPDKVPIAAR